MTEHKDESQLPLASPKSPGPMGPQAGDEGGTASGLPKEKASLRALIANSPKVKEVRFVSLGAIGTIGSQYQVPVHILIVDANGKSRPGVWTARLTKTAAGWRFGE